MRIGICERVVISTGVRLPKQPVSSWMMALTLQAPSSSRDSSPKRVEARPGSGTMTILSAPSRWRRSIVSRAPPFGREYYKSPQGRPELAPQRELNSSQGSPYRRIAGSIFPHPNGFIGNRMTGMWSGPSWSMGKSYKGWFPSGRRSRRTGHWLSECWGFAGIAGRRPAVGTQGVMPYRTEL